MLRQQQQRRQRKAKAKSFHWGVTEKKKPAAITVLV